MGERNVDAKQVHELLQDPDLKLVLDAPEGDYQLEYYTTAFREAGSDAARPARAYRLLDHVRGSVTQEPWDRFDLDKQTTLVTHLMEFGGYRMTKVVAGWKASCPACGHVVRGKIWESVPAACTGKGPPKCRYRYADGDVTEELRKIN